VEPSPPRTPLRQDSVPESGALPFSDLSQNSGNRRRVGSISTITAQNFEPEYAHRRHQASSTRQLAPSAHSGHHANSSYSTQQTFAIRTVAPPHPSPTYLPTPPAAYPHSQHAYYPSGHPYDQPRPGPYYSHDPYNPHPQYAMSYTFQSTVGVDSPSFSRKRRGNLPKEATGILKEWFREHRESPYPSEEQKAQLCSMSGLSLNQVGLSQVLNLHLKYATC
jgi:hypothetical protein